MEWKEGFFSLQTKLKTIMSTPAAKFLIWERAVRLPIHSEGITAFRKPGLVHKTGTDTLQLRVKSMPAMGHWNTPMEGTTMFSLETIWKVSTEEAMESHAVVRSENKVSDNVWEQSGVGAVPLGYKE